MIRTYEYKDRLNEYLLKAVAVHVMVVLLAIILNALFSLNLFSTHKVPKNIEIIQSAVRVDVVALPKMTLQELKKMNLQVKDPEPEEIKKTKVNETSKIEFKKKSKKFDLSKLLKGISSKKIKKVKAKKNKKTIDTSALKKLVLEGNAVSKGSSTTGERIDEGQQDFVSYIQSLPEKVRLNWKLPSYLLEKDLQCRIRIFIASNGNILKMKIIESSGDTEYDNKALDAVKKSSPLPKPLKSILSKVANGEVILGFPL
jgi:TonB family protein